MARAINTNILLSKTFKLFEFKGLWSSIFGQPSKGGIWIIYGKEKHGKTTFALKLADYLSQYEKTLYISGEEGLEKEFKDAVKRAGVNPKNKRLLFSDYVELGEVKEKLNKRHAPKIIIFDNTTVYNDELKNGELRRLALQYPTTTMIFLAHEEKGEPYTATAKLCKKLAKIIVHIEGLTAFISGRCPGGTITINEQTAMLYHGSQILNN
ncbi:P-loop NTPase family protein [Flavobacterium urocaniciphilum]|uniref:AAA+ ATPase domain-containing protein n=1 Tax=Flavobacterium urocaniciphilum TaxID=1299341 RepID=A0A1H9BR23_9FLAO|nr:hypothetical protein [Flavobacterium urocaniciphilum]SEP91349.1 hypothetical protein SAMN05444005_103158 [Flavobacterium urocaniciphilum]